MLFKQFFNLRDFQAFKCIKLLFCSALQQANLFLPPPHSQRLRSPQVQHSPFHSFFLFFLSLILLFKLLSVCLPPSLHQTLIVFRQRSEFKSLRPALRQKSTSEIQRCVIHIFVTTVDGVTAFPGVSSQSDTLKSPLQNQAGKIFKKKQLGEKL